MSTDAGRNRQEPVAAHGTISDIDITRVTAKWSQLRSVTAVTPTLWP